MSCHVMCWQVKTILCAHGEILSSWRQHGLSRYSCYKLLGNDI